MIFWLLSDTDSWNFQYIVFSYVCAFKDKIKHIFITSFVISFEFLCINSCFFFNSLHMNVVKIVLIEVMWRLLFYWPILVSILEIIFFYFSGHCYRNIQRFCKLIFPLFTLYVLLSGLGSRAPVACKPQENQILKII